MVWRLIGCCFSSIIAVAGLEGHAIESWSNTESGGMWLQNHLPKDIKNIRVLTYGYNSDLIGDTMEDTILDLRSNLFTHLLNARKTAQVFILYVYSIRVQLTRVRPGKEKTHHFYRAWFWWHPNFTGQNSNLIYGRVV